MSTLSKKELLEIEKEHGISLITDDREEAEKDIKEFIKFREEMGRRLGDFRPLKIQDKEDQELEILAERIASRFEVQTALGHPPKMKMTSYLQGGILVFVDKGFPLGTLRRIQSREWRISTREVPVPIYIFKGIHMRSSKRNILKT